jgi:hypothetical protein
MLLVHWLAKLETIDFSKTVLTNPFVPVEILITSYNIAKSTCSDANNTRLAETL